MKNSLPRSAYIHVPFCIHRCGYCNFSVVAGRGDLVAPYLAAIAKELSWLEEPRPVDTLYFGGGTPTYLTPEKLRHLCELVLQWHPLAENHEWTVEANPADLDAARIAVLAELGANRISLGAQSFRRQKLELLERDHSSDEILQAAQLSREAGLRVSVDLIFGTPGESLAQWQADLEKLVALNPDHVSTYGLTFERGTQFWSRRHRGELQSLPEELEREMYLTAIDTLHDAGYEHYEVSSFAQAGERSRHNEVYWSGRGYYAAGPGAASYVEGVRRTNYRSTTTYLKRVLADKSPVAEEETLCDEARAREALVIGLRRLDGVHRAEFRQQTGTDLDELAGSSLGRFVQQGLLADDGTVIKLTREGLLVSDGLWPHLL